MFQTNRDRFGIILGMFWDRDGDYFGGCFRIMLMLFWDRFHIILELCWDRFATGL